MDVVRRAMRQRATIEQRFQGFEDAEAWGTRLADIEADAEARRWTQARRALDALSGDLDAQERDRGEAEQLLDFLREEWRHCGLRLKRHRLASVTMTAWTWSACLVRLNPASSEA